MAYINSALAAVADPTRRQVFERLASGPRSVGELAEGLPVSRPAVSQHLKVLKDAGLVTDRAEGTRRVYAIDPQGLGALRAWLDQFWGDALEAFKIEAERKDPIMTTVPRIKPAPVRRSVFVKASPEHAFEVFTAGFDRWWPKRHSIGASPQKTAVMERKAGGRWYEVGEDGSQTQWGEVMTWEPPRRLVLIWRVGADWKSDPNLHTEVEVTFTPEGEGVRVDLEHRKLEAFGERAEEVVGAISAEGGWNGLLKMFAAEAAK